MNQHSVTIYWGEAAEHCISKEEVDSHYPERKQTYDFKTEEEHVAFMQGIKESEGWNGCLTQENYDALPDKTKDE